MLIGGGDNGHGTTTYETKEIDEEIVKMTNKNNPTFLFIGLASSFSDSYYDIMKEIYKNLGCKTTYLKKKNTKSNKNNYNNYKKIIIDVKNSKIYIKNNKLL